MPYRIIFLFMLLSAPSWSHDETPVDNEFSVNVITDPAISRRCQNLLDQRNEKVILRQKLATLLSRNERLAKITPPEKKSISRELTANNLGISKELRLVNLRIQRDEENLIRKGCPGIQL
ncbi:MAG: hypothetical protein ACN6I6_00275 [bacterium]